MEKPHPIKESIRKALAQKLPAWQSHIRLAPRERIEGLKMQLKSKEAKKSAVLLVIFEENKQLKLIFILRSIYNGAHSGQISFPGGQKDIADYSLKHTALRETQEEIGISLEEENILGKLSNLYIPNSNFIVEPYVAFADSLIGLEPEPKEVQNIYKISLEELLDENVIQEKEVSVMDNKTILAPCFYVKNLIIWGATAMILKELVDIIKSNDLITIIHKKNAHLS